MYLYTKTEEKDFNPIEEINSRLRKEDFFSFIYVVPTRRKVRYLIRELTELAPNKATPRLNIFTIGDLAEEIFKSKFIGWTKISSSLQYFLIKKILSETDLQYFAVKGKFIPNGLIELVINVITRLKEIGFSHSSFENEVSKFEGYDQYKMNDLSKIYSNYQDLLQHLNLFETGDVYLRINSMSQDEIEKSFRSVFNDVNYLLITGFNEFTKPELKLIEGLSKIRNLKTVVTLDFNENNNEIFENLIETHQHLINIGFNYWITYDLERNGSFNQKIKNELFNQVTSEKIKTKNIFKFTGFDARDEIETIARIIKHKVIQQPEIDLSKICIAINGIGVYSNLIREIFYKYGIPVNVTDRFYLKNSPPIISIIRLLELLRNDFFYKDLFYVLRSTYFSFENIDVDNLREILSLIKITRGKDKILASIENRLDYLNSLSLNENPRRDTEIEQLKKAEKDFQQIVDLLSKLEGSQTPESFVKKLREIIHNLNVYENVFSKELSIDEDINIITYSKDVRALNLFEDILEELLYTFEKLQLHRKTFSFNEYFEFITTAVFGSRYNVKERWGYGVLVTSPEEIRNLNFSILFLPGLENGLFPSKYFPLVLLDEKYIRTERQKLLEERYLFYQCLNSFEDELYLSYPRQDEKKEKIPSDFLVELEKICEIQELNLDELRNIIFSKSELFEKYSVEQLLDLNKENRELFARLSKIKEAVERINYRINNAIESEGKEYSGIITDEKLLDLLYTKFDKEFSITELETYAQCPFKYFLNYVVKLKIEEEIEEDIQRNEFGSIIHQILYQFLNKLKNENRNFYDELKTNYEKLSAEITEIAKGIIKHFERYNPFFFLTEEIILGSPQRKSILIQFLNLEKELIEDSNYNFQPSEFEKEISQEFNLFESKIKLKGKIDRIDINPTDNTFKVIDYKTGELPKPVDYKDRISLQLPLYLTLVKKYFQSINKELKIADAEFLKLSPKKSNNIERKSLINDYLKDLSKELSEELNDVMKTIALMIEKIKKGKFNLTTINNFERRVCSKCIYQGICRIDLVKKTATEDEITS